MLVSPSLTAEEIHKSVPPPSWPEITQQHRPWAFHWWLGNAVDSPNLQRELQQHADAGLGGVHVVPIYGAKGAEHRYLPYLSPKWLEAVRDTVQFAGKHQMGVDLTTGTGWCFGGPMISPELGGRKVVAKVLPFPKDGKWPKGIDFSKTTWQVLRAVSPNGTRENLLKKVAADGTLRWSPPGEGWQLHLLGHQSTGFKVKRSSPGGEGLMLNPFDSRAMQRFLAHHSQAFDQARDVKPRSMYHDSYEYYGCNWVETLPDAFFRRRGYRIEDEIPAFTGQGDPDRVARVRCDYRETLSDLLIEEVFPLWSKWCRQRGMKTRNQAHGAPANLLDFYNVADIPETEMFGHGGPDPLHSTFDAHIGGADRNPLIAKFASSAAHLSGKPLVSAETGTWLAEHFCESWAELKGLVDLMFVSGVNHIFYHGCVYSPADVAWPGWLFYAATQMNPRNPLWREVRTLNDYVARCQAMLQSGRPDHAVLLYWPVHDTFATASFQFTVHDHAWLSEQPCGRTARVLWERGYGFDYVSDRLLTKIEARQGQWSEPSGNFWQTVVVPEVHTIPLPTFRRLLDQAKQGGTVVFVGKLPEDVPGLGELESRRQTLRSLAASVRLEDVGDGVKEARMGHGRVLVGPLEAALLAAGTRREPLMDIPGMRMIRRTRADGTVHFVTNHATAAFDGWLPLATSTQTVLAMDPMTGAIGRLPCQPGKADRSVAVRVRLEPGQSLFFLAPKATPGQVAEFPTNRPGQELQTISTPWRVQFISGGPTLPAAFESAQSAPWTGRGDPQADAFSGTACYSTRFDLNASPGLGTEHPVLLDLGGVSQLARVRLNQRDLGCLIMAPFRLRIPPNCLKPTGNVLEIEVTNTGANRLRDLDQRKVPWRIFHDINFVSITYKPFNAAAWPVQPAGLCGPVRLLSLQDHPSESRE